MKIIQKVVMKALGTVLILLYVQIACLDIAEMGRENVNNAASVD